MLCCRCLLLARQDKHTAIDWGVQFRLLSSKHSRFWWLQRNTCCLACRQLHVRGQCPCSHLQIHQELRNKKVAVRVKMPPDKTSKPPVFCQMRLAVSGLLNSTKPR